MPSDWRQSLTISPPNVIEIKYKGKTDQLEHTVELQSITKSENKSSYETVYYFDESMKLQQTDLQISKADTTTKSIAATNGAYIKWRLENDMGLPYGDVTTQVITSYEYTKPAIQVGNVTQNEDGSLNAGNTSFVLGNYHGEPNPPALIKETTENYITGMEFIASMPLTDTFGYNLITPALDCGILSHRTIVEHEEIYLDSGRVMTRTKTSRWISKGLSPEGKEQARKLLTALAGVKTDDKAGLLQRAIDSFVPLVFEGTEVQVNIGKAPLPSRPNAQSQAAHELVNGKKNSLDETHPGETNNGTNEKGTTEKTSGQGSVESPSQAYPAAFTDPSNNFTRDASKTSFDQVVLGYFRYDNYMPQQQYQITKVDTYDLPFASDDSYIYDSVNGRQIFPGHARQQALHYGNVIASLDIAHAFGHNIVTSFDNMPTLELSPVYLRVAGIEGAFLTDSLSYAWGPDGMVVSSDLMLLGATGYYGDAPPAASWLRIPVSPSALPRIA